MIHEIKRTRNYAYSHGFEFAVRINGTSDLSPELFIDPDTGLNILQLFPSIQFYDYTKVFNRAHLMEKYPNYYLVFSYDGYNMEQCRMFLEMGGNIAVVFSNQERLPMYFYGRPVIDGNISDIRYTEGGGKVVGLHYHTTAANYKNGVYIEPDEEFVVKDDNPYIEWF